MLESLSAMIPQEWKGLYHLLVLPVFWIPDVQAAIWQAVWPASGIWALWIKRIFLLLPAGLLIAGLWLVMLSAYTLPFRSNRRAFLAAMAMNAWDMLKVVWLYWVGFLRFVLLLLGWIWGLAIMTFRLMVQLAKELILFPFRIGNQVSNKYFQPGVPWLAVLLTIFWSLTEAAVFTYTLMPTLSEVLSDLVGVESHRFLPGILFIMLFLMISGSFACLQVLAESLQQRNVKQVIQMLLVEFFVMFLEVFFLYRELVDSVTPWLAQQTGDQFRMGLYSTLGFATCGWLGIRGMTWFLFGRYGTPALLSIMARKKMEGMPAAEETNKPPEMAWAKQITEIFKHDIEWFRKSGEELAEVAILPVLQLLAVAVNFVMIFISGEAVFHVPFKHLTEVMDTSEIIARLGLKRPAKRPNAAE